MATQSIQPTFDLNPSSPSQESFYLKQETMAFMDNLIPFSNLLYYPYQFDNCPELEYRANQVDGADASVASGSPLLTPMLDAESGIHTHDPSFNDNSGLEVDDEFIRQISCFSSEEVKKVDAATDVRASCPTSEKHIFARSRPLVLSEAPTEMDKWTEYTGPVRLSGTTIEVSGWEPSDEDGLGDWELPCEEKLSNGCVSDNASRTMDTSNTNAKASTHMHASKGVNKYYWARRMSSNCHVPETHKKRQDGNSEKVDQPMFEHDAAPLRNLPQAVKTVNENAYPGQHKPASRFHIPSYIFPQPAIARLITQTAVENECHQAPANNNVFLLDQFCAEAEVTRRLVDEFLDIPDDTREEIMDFEKSYEKSYPEAFTSTSQSSMAIDGVLGHNFRPESVPSKIPTSSRRRSINCRPQLRVNASKSSAKALDDGISYFYHDSPTVQVCDSAIADTGSLPLRKHVLNDDGTTDSQRYVKRARF